MDCIRTFRSKLLLAMAAGMLSSVAGALPVVTGVSGNVAHGSRITISGLLFGVKSPAKPYVWAPMDGSGQPSSLGVVTSWAKINQLTYAEGCGAGGGGCLEGTVSNGTTTNAWVAGIDSPTGNDWNEYGRKTYVFRKSKKTFTYDTSKNVKIFRFWGTSALARPDFYFSIANGRIGIEGIPSPYNDYTMDSTKLAKAKGPLNEWYTEELSFKSNSSSDVADADLRIAVNGGADLVSFPNTNWMKNEFKLKTSSGYDNDGRMRFFYPLHLVVEGSDGWVPTAAGSKYWADDVYVDNTWARVMIGDAPTLSLSTYREIQIPSQWSASSIEVQVNIKAFPAGRPMFLFVVDSNGVASVGLPVSLGILQPVKPNPPASVTIQ